MYSKNYFNELNNKTINIYSKLLNNRIIFLTGYIENNMSNLIISQLLYLESINNKKDIFLYINSQGGLVNSGMSIYDTMKFIKPDVNTICIGQAYSMAALLLCSGKKKKRFSLPNSSIMIHQPLGQFKGQATEIKIQTNEILKIKKKIIYLISKNTGKKIKKITKDTERDKFFNTKEALNYGLIDKIIKKRN